MINASRFCYALSFGVAAASLAACVGTQLPNVAPRAVPRSALVARQASSGRSWMLAEARNENLMYVADPATGGVLVYSYRPARYKFVGFLLGLSEPTGECVDKAQHIYVANNSAGGSEAVFEYAHGRMHPIRILGPEGFPESCSVDSTTGNLAIVAFNEAGESYVALFRKARGKPIIYTGSSFSMFECAYDAKGNLFVVGAVVSGQLQLAELPKGRSRFENITLNQSFIYPGGIQRDGKYMAIADAVQAVIYRFAIAGSVGTKVGSTPLDGSNTVGQFFIAGSRVIAPSAPQGSSGYVKVYDYPAGGGAKRTLSNFSSPVAVVVSYRKE
jgi:hypothetical protein